MCKMEHSYSNYCLQNERCIIKVSLTRLVTYDSIKISLKLVHISAPITKSKGFKPDCLFGGVV